MIFPNGLVGLAFPCGRGGAGQQVFVLLIGKGSTLGFAVVVDNGQLILQIVVNAVVVLVVFPLRDILHGLGNRFGNLGFPADKDMIFPNGLVGLAFPCGRGGAWQQVFVLLIGKGSTLGLAVVVDNGQLILFVIGDTVVVLVVFPLRDIGHIRGHGCGDSGIPSNKDMILPNGLVGLALPCRRGCTGSKSGVNLIDKGGVVGCTVIISNSVLLNVYIFINEIEVFGAGIRLAAGDVRSRIDSARSPVIERRIFLALGIVGVKFPTGPVGCRRAHVGRIELLKVDAVVVTGMGGAVLADYSDCIDQYGSLISKRFAAVENNLVDLDRNLMPRAVGGKRSSSQTQHKDERQEHSQNSFLHYFHPFKMFDSFIWKARTAERFPA